MHIKTANGKKKIALSRSEWEAIGKQAGWIPRKPVNKIQSRINEIMSETSQLASSMSAALADERATTRTRIMDALDSAGDALRTLNEIAGTL